MNGMGRTQEAALHEAKTRRPEACGDLALRERMSKHPKLGIGLVACGVTGGVIGSSQLSADSGLFLLALILGSVLAAIGAVLLAFAFDAENPTRHSGT